MAYDPTVHIDLERMPIGNGINVEGSIYLDPASAEFLAMNQKIIYGALMDPQVLLPDDYGIESQVAYNSTLKKLGYHDGTKWVYWATCSGFQTKLPARLLSTSPIDLASPPATIDNVAVVNGDRVLLVGQTLTKANGIYVWDDQGMTSANRAVDIDEDAEFPGALVIVTEGDDNQDTIWLCVSDVVEVDVDPNIWNEWKQRTYVFGKGLTEAGFIVDVDFVPNSGLMFTTPLNNSSQLDVNIKAAGALDKANGLGVRVDATSVYINSNNQLAAHRIFYKYNTTIQGTGNLGTYDIDYSGITGYVVTGWTIQNGNVNGSNADSRMDPYDNILTKVIHNIGTKHVYVTLHTENNANYYITLSGYIL